MSNPYLIVVPFCNTGNKNTIQLTRQSSQDPEDATYQEGFPTITMLNEDAGGLAPKGLDFNGIFYELSSSAAHYCRGDRIQFDATYATAIGGYAKGWVVASNDYQKDYISLVDNNLADPNGTNTTWAVYAGQGSVPTATSTTTGTVKLVNSLASPATDAALTAAQGKVLQDSKLNTSNALGVGQTWKDMKASRINGGVYQNTTGKPIQVFLMISDTNGVALKISIGDISYTASYDVGTSSAAPFSFIVPNNTTYSFSWGTRPADLQFWWELR